MTLSSELSERLSIAIIVCAYNEAELIGETLSALQQEFNESQIVVADDGSTDQTAQIAAESGAVVVSQARNRGKGEAATDAARRCLLAGSPADVIIFCDADLGCCAKELRLLSEIVASGTCDLAVGGFEQRVGGGFGVAVRFAGWLLRQRCGLDLSWPISGQRALSSRALSAALPFGRGFSMEIAMTIAVADAGFQITEVALPLQHRATGRDLAGFIHRGRQLVDFVRLAIELPLRAHSR